MITKLFISVLFLFGSLQARNIESPISGRVIVAQKAESGDKTYTFMNDLVGHITLPIDHLRPSAKGWAVVHAEGHMPYRIDIASLSGLPLTGVKTGDSITGHMRGDVLSGKQTHRLDIPIKITRYDQNTAIIEPKGPIKTYTVVPPVELYFKFIVHIPSS